MACCHPWCVLVTFLARVITHSVTSLLLLMTCQHVCIKHGVSNSMVCW